jgi:hypothetical protein
MYVCFVMDMNNLLVHTPNVSNNNWELEDLVAVYISSRLLMIRPIYF